ncbi:MAG TPA: DUF4232 domain-containing protein [Actinoplanes sp.]|nr:DUF4232 domain-containing protein [Actinoplanes sp.]
MRTTFKAAVPALALLTALTACGGNTTATGTTAPAAPATSEAAAATTAATTAAATTAPSVEKDKSGNSCAPGDLKVSIGAQGTGEKDEKGMVIVTNDGKKNCTVKGWPTFVLYNPADEAVDVPTKQVNEPGPASTVEIKAGGSAFAGIKWTQCDKGDTTCGVGNTIKWSLDGAPTTLIAELDGFPAPEKVGITMKALKIGTFQPSNQGVTAW